MLQGCPLTPLLFNSYPEVVMREVLEKYTENGVKIGGLKIANSRYADDINLLDETPGKLQEIASSVYTT